MKHLGNLVKGRISSKRRSSSHALDGVFRQYATLVYQFLYRRVGNRQDAEDLTSMVFLKAVQWLEAARPAEQVQAWLYATARAVLADHWHAALPDTVDLAEVEEILCAPPAEGAMEEDKHHRISVLLDALPEQARAVLTLRFLRGYSVSETAKALGMTETNVKVTQHRALKQAAQQEERGYERRLL